MSARPHLPNIPGCAFGFGAAGCGVGSLIGTALGSHLSPAISPGEGTPHERVMAFYGSTLWGSLIGVGVGVVVGVLYAVLVRRSRLRETAHDT